MTAVRRRAVQLAVAAAAVAGLGLVFAGYLLPAFQLEWLAALPLCL